jgi:hypothetical protein
MDIYSQVAAASTREALGRLGNKLRSRAKGQLLQFAAANALTQMAKEGSKVGLTRSGAKGTRTPNPLLAKWRHGSR